MTLLNVALNIINGAGAILEARSQDLKIPILI
jgi:hypothetical protein